MLHAAVTLTYAAALLLNPYKLASFMGLMIISSDGQAELLAMYLGLSGVLGIFMLVGAWHSKWLPPAFLFLLLSMTGITSARFLSFLFLDSGSYTLNALFYDFPVTFLAWFTLWKK